MRREISNKITWRAFLVSFLLIIPNHYWVIQLESIGFSYPTYVAPFYNVIFILFILIGLNQLVRLVFPRASLNPSELVVVYVILSISSTLGSYGMLQYLLPVMSYPLKFATPENEWQQTMWPYLPKWLMLGVGGLPGFFSGGKSFLAEENLSAWIVPALFWSAFFIVLTLTLLCLSSLFRKQWTEHERLSYPIIQLPFEMTSRSKEFFSNKLVWIGFGIAAGISLWNGLSFLVPGVPALPVKRQAFYFSQRPWNAISSPWEMWVSFYPFAIGMGFLMPLELSFSAWFFHILLRLQMVAGQMTSIRPFAHFSNTNAFHQALGAYMGIGVVTLWSARGHLRTVGKAILKGKQSIDEGEPMTYRTAALGSIIGIVFLTGFLSAAGMSVWLAILFFAFYILLSITITQMRVRMGFPVHILRHTGPPYTFTGLIGTRKLGNRNINVLGLTQWFNRGYGGHSMPHQLEGFKLSELAGIRKRTLTYVLISAAIVGTISAFYIIMHIYYWIGADNIDYGTIYLGREAYSNVSNWLQYPTEPNYMDMGLAGIGLGVTVFLMTMRSLFLWWSFHPLGFAIAGTWGMATLWSCLLISSIIKWSILKYGGLKSYRRAVPLFLGLILGDFTIGSIWNLLGLILGTEMYSFWI